MFLTFNIIILLYALGSSAHTLSRIQITNGSEIYEIREKPNNMFEIIEPKPKKPTLREIIFFKIIETPYKDHSGKEKSSQEQGPDFDDSERPFTNGPGIQFLDFEPINDHKSSEDDGNSKNDGNNDKDDSVENTNTSNDRNDASNESRPDSNASKNDSKESKNDSNSGSNENKKDSQENKNDSQESNNDSNSGSNESKNDNNGNKSDSNERNTDSKSKADNDKLVSDFSNADKKDDDKINENKENDSKYESKRLDNQSRESKNINKNNDNTSPDFSQTTEPAATLTKIEAAIQERNKQFDVAKEKYQDINNKSDNSTKLLRRKRDIDFSMPPPPPVLSPLNVRILPDFIQRMISNVPALKDMVTPDEGSEYINQDESRPRTYGFHLNKDKGVVWNHLPYVDQENYINEPSILINKDKKEESQENSSPDSSFGASSSGSDDNSQNYDNDSGDSVPDDKSSDDDSIGDFWHNVDNPQIDFDNFKPYQKPITKEKDSGNFVDKISKDTGNSEQHVPNKPTTEANINYHQKQTVYKNSKEKEPKTAEKTTPLPKTKININKDLKEKIEMSFDKLGKIVPPMITRFEEKLVKTAVDNNEPLTFGMKLSGDNGYVWNDLANPGKQYLIGEALDKIKEWNEPSSPATEHFNEYNTESTIADESATEANEPTDSPIHEDNETNKITAESPIENKTQEPAIENLKEPNKESLNKDENNSDEKKDAGVEVALDDLLKKDEFWQWLTKWTAAYIEVLNEHVEELVKREVAKQINKTLNHKIDEEKDKIYANNTDLNNKNETIANITAVEPANKTNEMNTNITTTEKSIPEINNTLENITPKSDKIKAINRTGSDGHKSNKTTPANAHTIYGNAIDSDHVTNIFIFYPNAENNATAKDIEAILGKTNNNVVILGSPSNDNKDSKAPNSSTDSPVDDTTGIYAIDKKKDTVPNTSELTSKTSETTISNDNSTTDIPSKEEPITETTTKNEDTTATTKTDTTDTSEATTSSDTGSNVNATTDAVSSNTESTVATDTETATPTVDATTVVPDTSTAS